MSTTIKQAIDGFLLSCKVEGKSDGTIDCYSDTAFFAGSNPAAATSFWLVSHHCF